jgi:alpha-tubulin suppressor-like RCC1 family protein
VLSLLFTVNAMGQEDDFQMIDPSLNQEDYDYIQEYDFSDDLPEPEVIREILQANAVVDIDLGIDHTCALMASGKIQCWGDNLTGQLGDGTATDSNRPVTVSGISDAIGVSAGYHHSCAVLRNGRVTCWGSNTKGALGLPLATQWAATPTTVPGVEDAIDVAAGMSHTCALLSNGRVMCWGDNEHGQLGNGGTAPSPTPLAVNSIRFATMLSSSGEHTCVGEDLGTAAGHVEVKCWGRNTDGQAGNPATGDILWPNRVAIEPGIIDISAGINHTCYVGPWVPRCFGNNAFGQIGVGHTVTPLNSPVYGYTDVTNIAAGRFHTCGRTRDGFVRCWGSNLYGELGLGNYRSDAGTWSPYYPVFGVWGNALDMESGLSHSCALLTDRSVVCWGLNGNGQLGDGSNIKSNKPVAVVF